MTAVEMESVVLSTSPHGSRHRVSTTLKPSTNQQVRNRFLNMIGIEKKLPATEKNSTNPCADGTPANSTVLPTNEAWVNPRTQMINISTEPLKYDPYADNVTSLKRRKTEDEEDNKAQPPSGKQRKKKKLIFSETVKVVPIPMRNEYSNRVRARLWSNTVEIHENATRNTVEFAAEGWDWRAVIEDEGMYVCLATGDLVHPVHYQSDFCSTES